MRKDLITEKDFQQAVIDYARLRGWMTYHTHDSRRSTPGFPDLVMVRPPYGESAARLVFAELKREDGRLSNAQKLWIGALRSAGLDVRVWRPSDMDEILEALE